MAKFSFDLSEEIQRLITCGFFITAGVLTASVSGIPGAALIGTAAALAQEFFAADMMSVISRRLGRSDRLLRNHDLTKAIGQAISVVIRATAKDQVILAEACEKHWESFVKDNAMAQALAKLKEADLTPMLSAKQALDPDTWQFILEQLADRAEIRAFVQLALPDIARNLHERFAEALREVLKFDFSHNGKAFPAMVLLALGDIAAAVERLEQGGGGRRWTPGRTVPRGPACRRHRDQRGRCSRR